MLRHRRFSSEAEASEVVRKLLIKLNQRPFRKREGSRVSQFAELDKPALKPLPGELFDLSHWSQARANIDSHIAFDGSFYSVPYNLVQEQVDVRSTATTIEIPHKGTRVASHLRSRTRGHAITTHEDRPHSTWSGPRRASCTGAKRLVRIPPNCSNASWRTGRIPRRDIEPALG